MKAMILSARLEGDAAPTLAYAQPHALAREELER